MTYTDKSTGAQYSYPANYGEGQCQAWDSTVPPDCTGVPARMHVCAHVCAYVCACMADTNGVRKTDAPTFCGSKWCYVNKVRQVYIDWLHDSVDVAPRVRSVDVAPRVGL